MTVKGRVCNIALAFARGILNKAVRNNNVAHKSTMLRKKTNGQSFLFIPCLKPFLIKHKTKIKKGAFVGSDAMLVAPVTIGEGAMVGAGSVITKDVPAKSLGIERNQQKNIDGYMDRKKSSKDKK